MKNDKIIIRNANTHNLKNISLEIPKNTFTVITGPSGSGKSSLAFDTIYAEGQRRYIESLSSYARQFIDQLPRPDVESISGLSPAIAIDQKSGTKNPRSTVGTLTEIYDFLRVLFSRVGLLTDPITGELIKKYSPAQVARYILDLPIGSKIQLLIPIILTQDNFTIQKDRFLSEGFSRLIINNESFLLEDLKSFDKSYDNCFLVIDRIITKPDGKSRIINSVEHAYRLADGKCSVLINNNIKHFYEYYLFSETNEIIHELEPRLFSFNSPHGACSECNGLGKSDSFLEKNLIFDSNLSIIDGAIPILNKNNSALLKMIKMIASTDKINLKTPLKLLPKQFIEKIIYGSDNKYNYHFSTKYSHLEFSKQFPGIINYLKIKYKETKSLKIKKELEQYLEVTTCSKCDGQRLNPKALCIHINSWNIINLNNLPIKNIISTIKSFKFSKENKQIATPLLKEIYSRLEFLIDVGLGYLSLSRASNTLSGGENQRIRLATQIGSTLSGVLYVLDEPSIGLHHHDNLKLIKTIKNLTNLGNTLLVIEHDEETIRSSDYIIDMGPAAGKKGGEVTAIGTLDDVLTNQKSLTAKYINKEKSIPIPNRRDLKSSFNISEANANNLKNLDVKFPLGGLVCITGVSGSGKSTLMHKVTIPALKSRLLSKSIYDHKNYRAISNIEKIKSLIELNQSPIGKSQKSNPATYTGIFDEIRKLFSKTSTSKIKGYDPGRFSFNVKGGRCEECEGNGVKKIEMHFIADVFVTCSECQGKKYNQETLSVYYKGKNIDNILNLTVKDALDFFSNIPKIKNILDTLDKIGLGYITLGQPANTLSGGESQRIKLAKELSKRTYGHCLYVLDEPTIGLHTDDIKTLINIFNLLIEKDNSIIIIEHNLDILKSADYIIDLGPDGGENGGQIVAQGTPEYVAKNFKSYTAMALKKIL